MKKTFLCLFLLTVFSLPAVAEFSFDLKTESLSIQKGLQASISLSFSNQSEKTSQITVRAEPSSTQLETVLHETFITLQPKETTSFSLTIKPKTGISDGTYTVKITASDDENVLKKLFA